VRPSGALRACASAQRFQLTSEAVANKNLAPKGSNQMALKLSVPAAIAALAMAAAIAVGGCGVFYQAGTRIKAERIDDSLHVGETMAEVHRKWGEPDIRNYVDKDSELWSYPYKPNSDDLAAKVFFTSDKSGDKGTFLDLKFMDGKLVSWTEADHVMPVKEGEHLTIHTFGLGGGGITPPGGSSSGTAHY